MKKQAKNKKNKLTSTIKAHKNVLILLILICFVISILCVGFQTISESTETFVVEQGQISQEETAVGYIIRDETVVQGENYSNGMIQIKTEGEKVAKGDSIFRYYSNNEESLTEKIAELDEQINEAMAEEETVTTSDTKVLENQISEKIDECYNESNLETIRENKESISTYVNKKAKIAGEYSSSGSYLKKLIDERSSYENELNEGAEYVVAPVSGVVSYRVDGYEDILTTDDFGSITKELLESINLKTGQMIATSDENGKIIDNYECYIAVILSSDEAKEAEVGDTVTLRLSSGSEVSADIEYINQSETEEYIIIFRIEKSVEELISYRKISFDIIWWDYSGNKVPVSAIQYEQIGENTVAYVIRIRNGYQDKIWVKELKTNGKYTIVSNYTSDELEELGYSAEEIKSRKKIQLYDEILLLN